MKKLYTLVKIQMSKILWIIDSRASQQITQDRKSLSDSNLGSRAISSLALSVPLVHFEKGLISYPLIMKDNCEGLHYTM